MKKILFIFILFFNIVPKITNNSFSLLQINTAKAQNTNYILQGYLTALNNTTNPNSGHSFNVTNHGCGCQVIETGPNGALIRYHNSVAYQNSPGYQYFQTNGTINTSPPNNGDNANDSEDENDLDNDFEVGSWISNYLFERENQTLTIEDLQNLGFGFEGNGPNNQNNDCSFAIYGYSSEVSYHTGEKARFYNSTINNINTGSSSIMPCAQKFLIGKQVVEFTTNQSSLINGYVLNGSVLEEVRYNGRLFRNVTQWQAVKITDNFTTVDSYCLPTQAQVCLFSNPTTSNKFVCFEKLDSLFIGQDMDFKVGTIQRVYASMPNGDLNIGYNDIPQNEPEISFSIPISNVKMAVEGDVVWGINANGLWFCDSINNEDIDRGNHEGRDNEYVPDSLHLDFFINPPKWVRDFIKKIAPKLNDCEIDYINVQLDALHLKPDYKSASSNSRKKMEIQSLAYDIIFGILYCNTNADMAKGKSCAAQEGLGVMHELISTIDVAQMRDGIVHLVNGVGNFVATNVSDLLNGIKDIATQYVSTGDVDFKKIAKDFIRKNIALADSAYNKAAEIANHFKKMYFTGCGTEAFPDGTTADMCCYRDGELTAMVIPIILSAGDYAVVKLTGLAAKYGIGSTKAIRLLDDAAKSGATIIDNIAGETKIIEQASIGVDELETVIKKENINDVKFKRDDNYFEPYPTNVNPPIIGGQKPKNYEFANKIFHTKSGYDIPFDADGFPDMNAVSQRTVRINNMEGAAGNNGLNDFKKANFEAFGVADPNYHLTVNNGQNVNYTWHHHQDTKSMMLVPKAVNNPFSGGVSHTGGSAIVKHVTNGGLPFNFPSPPLK